MSDKKCVVCSSPAEIFCHNDNAYLCALCDSTVHQAHPLAASHVREPIGKVHAEDSLDQLFEVPTVPDALCDVKDTLAPKTEQVSAVYRRIPSSSSGPSAQWQHTHQPPPPAPQHHRSINY